MSNNPGKVFEGDFKDSVPKEAHCLKLNDAAAGFLPKGSNKRIRFSLPSPYDYAVCYKGRFFAFELKSTDKKSLSYGERKNCSVRKKQVEELCKSERAGAIAGLVINFRAEEKTYFVPAGVFQKYMEGSSKASINEQEVESLGILIPQELKKVHYRYRTERIFEIADNM